MLGRDSNHPIRLDGVNPDPPVLTASVQIAKEIAFKYNTIGDKTEKEAYIQELYNHLCRHTQTTLKNKINRLSDILITISENACEMIRHPCIFQLLTHWLLCLSFPSGITHKAMPNVWAYVTIALFKSYQNIAIWPIDFIRIFFESLGKDSWVKEFWKLQTQNQQEYTFFQILRNALNDSNQISADSPFYSYKNEIEPMGTVFFFSFLCVFYCV